MNVETWNDIFEDKFANLDDDQVDVKEEQIGFYDEKPLSDFEERFRFNSLRMSLNVEIDNWLANPVLDDATDPDDHFVSDEDMRAMLTPNCLAKIGNEIVDFCYADTNNRIGICPDSDCCHTGHESSNRLYNNNNRRIKVTVTLRAWLAGSTLRGKIRHYRRKSNGNWKKSRTRLKIQCGGTAVKNQECTPAGPVGDFKNSKRRKRYEVAFTALGGSIMRSVEEGMFAAGEATDPGIAWTTFIDFAN